MFKFKSKASFMPIYKHNSTNMHDKGLKHSTLNGLKGFDSNQNSMIANSFYYHFPKTSQKFVAPDKSLEVKIFQKPIQKVKIKEESINYLLDYTAKGIEAKLKEALAKKLIKEGYKFNADVIGIFNSNISSYELSVVLNQQSLFNECRENLRTELGCNNEIGHYTE